MSDNKLIVAEGIDGVWFYHLATPGAYYAICGKPILAKQLPLSLWGYRGNAGERYCETCKLLHKGTENG